jgi:hypothetical protein
MCEGIERGDENLGSTKMQESIFEQAQLAHRVRCKDAPN